MPTLDDEHVAHFFDVLIDQMVAGTTLDDLWNVLTALPTTCARLVKKDPMWGITIELTPPIAATHVASLLRLENVGAAPADSHFQVWKLMTRPSSERYHARPMYGSWTANAILERSPGGERMAHEGRFVLYPVGDARVATLEIAAPRPPIAIPKPG